MLQSLSQISLINHSIELSNLYARSATPLFTIFLLFPKCNLTITLISAVADPGCMLSTGMVSVYLKVRLCDVVYNYTGIYSPDALGKQTLPTPHCEIYNHMFRAVVVNTQMSIRQITAQIVFLIQRI